MTLLPWKIEKIHFLMTLKMFYTCTNEILSGCLTAWYGNYSDQDHKKNNMYDFDYNSIQFKILMNNPLSHAPSVC